ncbi:MAG: T9SS type A sorting domain-containing protein [Flavobacteriales bacterium]|nr:T9SS type A sorting domain-containing protein [Flavobacteriales bacterium]
MALSASSFCVAQEWEELGDSPFSGRHHGIGFSANGHGYVVTGSFTNEVWKYNPENDSWEELEEYSNLTRGYGIGDMTSDIGYFGFGLTFGGPVTGEAKDLWRFDTQTESFEQLEDCPCTPRSHPALVTFGDKIYMGLGGNNGNLGDWWEYDIPSDSWTEKASFIGANRHHPYQFVIGDFIYVGSGHFSDWYRYDPANDQWTQIADHPSYIRVAGAQFAHDGKGYTLSGVADYNNDDHQAMPTGEFWEYDPDTDIWTELPPHPGQSRWAPAYFIIDDWVYMVAGETYDGENATYRYFLGESVTSVNELESKQALDLFPMPFVDHLLLPDDRNWVSARLFDITGALLISPGISGQQIEMKNLTSGVYFIELWDGEQVYQQKVVKQ